MNDKTMNRLKAAAMVGVVVMAGNWVAAVPPGASEAPPELDGCNVVFDTPSTCASGAVPLGNGRVGASAWIEPNGDLVMVLSSPDSFSGTPNLLKLGRVRISLAPAPLAEDSVFKQTLKLREGRLEADLGKTRLEVFVEPDQPVVRVIVTADKPFAAIITNETWRTERTNAGGWTMGRKQENADIVVGDEAGDSAIASYHRVEHTSALELLKLQSCDELPGIHDPVMNRTFGVWIEGPGLIRRSAMLLETRAPANTLDVRIVCPVLVAETAQDWIAAARSAAAAAPSVAEARALTEERWKDFWARSWLLPVADNDSTPGTNQTPVAQAYTLQRYVTACQGRGEFPIKFNGGIFTVDPVLTKSTKPFTPDFREWGDAYWYQNTRHMYHPLLMSGDFDLMMPFFDLYERARPLAEARSKSWYGSDGCFFPETMSVFGTYAAKDYGLDRTGRQPGDVQSAYVGRMWNQGLELVSLMLDYWEWTQDESFARERLVPMAVSVLQYFDTRFARDEKGRLVVHPTQVLETYQTGVTNDVVNIAGLRAILPRLEQLPDTLAGAEQKAFFARMQASCPPLPMMEVGKNGKTMQVLAPAEFYDPKRRNYENPELYTVWPFCLYGLGKPDLEMARATYSVKKMRLDKGWGYDGNAAALLGLTNEARRIMLVKCANSHPAHRFPASWGPNFDWLPDMNHGGNLMNTLQLMLLQAEGRKIYLLPAWPREWDCKFKLHAPLQTVLEGEVKDGQLLTVTVTPESRRADVVHCWESR